MRSRILAMNYKAKFDKEIKATMTKKYKYSSPLAVPRIVKIVVNTGVGRLKDEKEKELIQKFTSMIAGIKEHIAFPEIIGEDVKTIFGLEATLVTNAKSRDEALELYRELGIPFKK